MNSVFTVDQYKYDRNGKRISFPGNWLIKHDDPNRKQRRMKIATPKIKAKNKKVKKSGFAKFIAKIFARKQAVASKVVK